jgi:hypothetical protein
MAELTAPKKYGRSLRVEGELHHYHHLPREQLLEMVEGKLRTLGLLVGEDGGDR